MRQNTTFADTRLLSHIATTGTVSNMQTDPLILVEIRYLQYVNQTLFDSSQMEENALKAKGLMKLGKGGDVFGHRCLGSLAALTQTVNRIGASSGLGLYTKYISKP